MAKLVAKYGAMNCGKSTRLIQTAHNYTEQGLVVVTTMPAIGEREPGYITARAGMRCENNIPTTPETDFREALASFQERAGLRAVNAILADEVNFNTPEQVDTFFEIAKRENISVVGHAIRSDIRRHLFNGTQRLFELADSIHKIETMCTCGSQAEFNGRFVEGVFHVGDPIVMIDNDPGRIQYRSMCGICYDEYATSEGAITLESQQKSQRDA